MPGMAELQPSHGIDGEARAFAQFEVADADPRAAGNPFGRGKARSERRHVSRAFLQRIARGNQPPDFVETKSLHRRKADMPVPGVGRVEGAAEKPDARHLAQLT